MKRIFVHIGTGKTGSTTLQKSLFRNKMHNDHEVFCPRILDSKGSQLFKSAFSDLNSCPNMLRMKYKNDPIGYSTFQQSIKEDFKNQVSQHESVVISSEFLWKCDEASVREIYKFLRECLFDEIYVILYVRDPADYYLSLCQQKLKNQAKIPHPTEFEYDFHRAIDLWASFQPKDIVVREFNRKSLVGYDVLSDFSDVLNNYGYNMQFIHSDVKNSSMSTEACCLLQDIQKYVGMYTQDSKEREEWYLRMRKFSNSSAINLGSKPKLKPNVRLLIYKRFSESIRQASTRFGIFSDIDYVACESNSEEEDRDYAHFSDITEGFKLGEYAAILNSKLSV